MSQLLFICVLQYECTYSYRRMYIHSKCVPCNKVWESDHEAEKWNHLLFLLNDEHDDSVTCWIAAVADVLKLCLASGPRPRGLWTPPRTRSRAGDTSASSRWGRTPAVRPTTCPCPAWSCTDLSRPSARTSWVWRLSRISDQDSEVRSKIKVSFCQQARRWRRPRPTCGASADSSAHRWWSTSSPGLG